MRIHPDDNFTERYFFNNGIFPEEDSLAFLAGFLKDKPALFLDIGANAGVFSLRIAGVLAQGGRISAFEPNPVLVRRLRANIALNNLSAIEVFPCALGAETGVAALSFPNNRTTNLGEASIRPHENEARSIPVPVRSLAASLGSDAGDFTCIAMKIDIEGYEDRVLEPFFRQAASSVWPDLILIEIAHAAQWETDVPQLLSRHGYSETRRLDNNAVYELGSTR